MGADNSRYSESLQRSGYSGRRKSHRALIENLLAYISDRAGWVESAREYAAEEYRYRVGLLVTGTVFLTIAVIGVITALVLLIYSAYLLVLSYTENAPLSAFLVAWVAVLLGAAFLMLALGQYRDVAGKRKDRSAKESR